MKDFLQLAFLIILVLALSFGLCCLQAWAFQYVMLKLANMTIPYWNAWWLTLLIQFVLYDPLNNISTKGKDK